jgi:hypothetical protein
LALQPSHDHGIVPASEIEVLELIEERPRRRRRGLPIWVRLVLLVLAGIWLTVFTIGALLTPYNPPPAVALSTYAIGQCAAPDGQGTLVALAAIATDKSDPETAWVWPPKSTGTHQGPPLNLPQCTFKEFTGLPCPSCGMTTSFSLLVHGDIWNSMRANFAGTALALLGMFYIPWSIASAWRGRFLFIQSLEMTLFRLSIGFIILLFGRWGIALAIIYFSRSGG